jgi:hypothetical protein
MSLAAGSPRAWPVLALLLAPSACHVVSQSELVRPGPAERIRRTEAAAPRPPELVLAGDRLRFIERLECPTEEVIAEQRALELVTRPNLATFVVGVIASSAGAILTIRGASDAHAVNPFLAGGLAALAGGLPLAIGPWIGNHTELRPVPGAEPVRRPGPAEPCGDRPASARAATLAVRGIEVHGRVDRAGVFAISPYQLVDAFEVSAAAALDLTAELEAPAGAGGRARTVQAVIAGGALAGGAKAFLARADFDPAIEPVRLVPNIAAGTLRLSLASTDDGPAVRVVLPLRNDGPGPAFALRGHLTAPGAPAIDGRVIYVGRLANGAAATRELLIPIREAAAAALRNAPLEASIELRDAHGTAPATPVRFRGALLVDAPR